VPPFGAEHVRLLLGHSDEHHLVGAGEPVEVLLHHLVLAFPLGEVPHRNIVSGGKVLDVSDEPLGHRSHQRGRSDREPPVPHQEPGHLPGALQLRDENVQIHPVDALDLEPNMSSQHLRCRAR